MTPGQPHRNGIVFVPIVVALVVGIYLAGALNPGPQSPTESAPPSACGVPFKFGSGGNLSVLVASPGSTGEICVEYNNMFNNSVSSPTFTTIYEYNSSGVNGVCDSCNIRILRSIPIMASQDAVSFTPSPNPDSEIADVTYTIATPTNATAGVYGVFLFQVCSLFPMYIAPNGGVAQINASELAQWFLQPGFHSCPGQDVGARVLGVSGFSVSTVSP